MTTPSARMASPLPYYGLLLAIHVVSALKYAYSLPFLHGLDETGHASYALFILRSGELFPDMTTMPMLNMDLLWGEHLIYLHHPPVYYWTMAAVAALADTVSEQILTMRLANVALSALTLVVSIACPERLPLPPWQRVFGAAMMSLAPMLGAIGGAVSNDNQAMLGGALAVLGLIRLLDDERGAGSWAMLAIGTALAVSSKANAAILAGVFSGAGLLLLVLRDPRLLRRPQPWAAVLVMALSLVPYVIFTLRYGSPVPDFPGVAARGRMQAAAAGDFPILGLFDYTLHFMVRLVYTWASMVLPVNTAAFVAPALLFALTGAGLVISLRRLIAGDRNPVATVGALAAIAIIVCLPIHFLVVYRGHLAGSVPGGIWSRYYMPLMPALMAAALVAILAIPMAKLRAFGQAVLLAGAVALYMLR